jgi:hypothetical protein
VETWNPIIGFSFVTAKIDRRWVYGPSDRETHSFFSASSYFLLYCCFFTRREAALTPELVLDGGVLLLYVLVNLGADEEAPNVTTGEPDTGGGGKAGDVAGCTVS